MAKNRTNYNNKTSDCGSNANRMNSTNCSHDERDKAENRTRNNYQNTRDAGRNSEASEVE